MIMKTGDIYQSTKHNILVKVIETYYSSHDAAECVKLIIARHDEPIMEGTMIYFTIEKFLKYYKPEKK